MVPAVIMLIYEVKFCVQNLADFHEIDMKKRKSSDPDPNPRTKHSDSNSLEFAFITQSTTYRSRGIT